MTNVMLCTGTYAQTPYFWKKPDLQLHSMEEMCFYIVRNRYLIDQDYFDHSLVNWIREECSMGELADRLDDLLYRSGSVVDLCMEILQAVGYNTPEEIEKTRETLTNNTDMDIYEKHLAQADFLVENQKYSQAYAAYEELKQSAPKGDLALQAQIHYNEGIMNTRLYDFEEAATCFQSAYEMDHSPRSYLSYLSALRLAMPEKEYVDRVSGDRRAYQFSLTLESMIREAEEAYAKSTEYQMIKQLFRYRRDGLTKQYYALVEKITRDQREAYRQAVQEDVRNTGADGIV